LTEQTIKEWLTESYDYERPRRGQVREGVIVGSDDRGIIVDLGLKRDGLVPEADIERLGQEIISDLQPGREVEARIVRPEDRDGNIVLSMYQARLKKDWDRAHELLESGEVWQGEVIDYNKGGLIVYLGRLRGFVPGSHLWARRRGHGPRHRREQWFQEYIGQELSLKVIEVDRNKRRLVLSERLARKQIMRQKRERLLNELIEGEVVQGTVQRLCDFGAFVDVGGADGLVHISELAWRHVQHPSEVLQVGEDVTVYVLKLDHKRKRIGLSLKRLQPHPWNLVDADYSEGQLVSGTVTGIKDFGAFVALEAGVEGLVHISELADPPPEDPRAILQRGDELVVRILHIDTFRHRIGLSLKAVSAQEREKWLARQSPDQAEEPVEGQGTPAASASLSDNGKDSMGSVDASSVVATPGASDRVA
jgi:small subunit ribosomal protein S1